VKLKAFFSTFMGMTEAEIRICISQETKKFFRHRCFKNISQVTFSMCLFLHCIQCSFSWTNSKSIGTTHFTLLLQTPICVWLMCLQGLETSELKLSLSVLGTRRGLISFIAQLNSSTRVVSGLACCFMWMKNYICLIICEIWALC